MNKALFALALSLLVGVALSLTNNKATGCITAGNCLTRDWVKIQRSAANEHISLVFAIKYENVDLMERILYSVSDPQSPKFTKYLTREEAYNLINSAASLQIVKNWLLSNGIARTDIRVTESNSYIIASMTVKTAEKLLNTEFFFFNSVSMEETIIRCLEFSVPEFISQHLDLIANTIDFPPRRVRQGLRGNKTSIDADGNTTPALLTSFYKITSNTVASSSATQSLFESLLQYYSPTDLTSFQKAFNVPVQAIGTVIGTNKPTACTQNPNNCVEANLDVQYIMAIAQGSPTTFWSIANSGDIFLNWILAVADAKNPPLVHSMSYGSVESEENPDNMKRFNTEAMTLGTQGITIIIASGDDGVANYVARSDPSQCGFNPSWPASSPYVTAVGATQGPENGTPEIMCSSSTNGLITSGGGFSAVFATPDYQTTQVSNYLSNGPNLPPISQFNSKGRGYPDVAFLAHNYLEVDGGQQYQVSGTSAAAPTFAGFITLINGLRIKAGKAPLGFLNNLLYKMDASVFNDITSGTNNCCAGSAGSQVCCKYGFTAGTGWDPTTGFGSANFPALSNALLNA